MNSITIQNVYPKYFIPKNDRLASQIWNQNITFQKGDSYLIIAPSGSGKSTLASAILGNHFQYEGAILYDAVSIKSLSIEQLVAHRKNGVQLLFQDVRLIPELTLKENILLRIFDKNEAQYLDLINDYSNKLGITQLLDKKAMNCSYGERQRAAIVRSLINPANFLLFDECFSHLDVENKRNAFNLIQSVAQEQGKAIVFFELNEFSFQHSCKTMHL
ncbi:Probable ABC-type transport system, ATPase component [Flavobacterium indicum GPTSA100-9 = DSM 17447]|uniref:Probable ABC-type transport system, ATPase component n=1 Tax=Flavobacterium indicum (strain DSM 17447 / CIP 109464 / GPTSA100-9) TaxID=1094466 RepID=H8XTC3_FLAIG|nr:ATP-binding cassette domain-containing protein [Flavobacterium indicum]CCG52720.1 Probable ABC-type transport system, ATPase component [Flavobacterium indicum GPTSA100-9 = DSM 17447]